MTNDIESALMLAFAAAAGISITAWAAAHLSRYLKRGPMAEPVSPPACPITAGSIGSVQFEPTKTAAYKITAAEVASETYADKLRKLYAIGTTEA